MEDELNKAEINNSLLSAFRNSKTAAHSIHSEYYTVRKEFKGRHISLKLSSGN